jgi:hypothetical protein
MAAIIKTNQVQGATELAAKITDAHLVHDALATPDSGVMNVDHSLAGEQVRLRMVERVRALIAAGFYDRPEFVEMLAEKVLREM